MLLFSNVVIHCTEIANKTTICVKKSEILRSVVVRERVRECRESPGKHGEKTRGDFLRNYQTQYSIVFAIPDLIKIRNTPADINSIGLWAPRHACLRMIILDCFKTPQRNVLPETEVVSARFTPRPHYTQPHRPQQPRPPNSRTAKQKNRKISSSQAGSVRQTAHPRKISCYTAGCNHSTLKANHPPKNDNTRSIPPPRVSVTLHTALSVVVAC
ncbi:hypothetical protein CBL_00280 [Carabus blaptoides fortunei]